MFLALLSKVVGGCPHNDDSDNMGRKVGRLVFSVWLEQKRAPKKKA